MALTSNGFHYTSSLTTLLIAEACSGSQRQPCGNEDCLCVGKSAEHYENFVGRGKPNVSIAIFHTLAAFVSVYYV